MQVVRIEDDDTTNLTWEGACEQCGETVSRYHGEGDVRCGSCGAEYNCFGQRLRDDWRANESNWNEDIGDMEGYERACLAAEAASEEW